MTDNDTLETLGRKIDIIEKWGKRLKIIWVLITIFVGTIFAAGWYTYELKQFITAIKTDFENIKNDIQNLKKSNPVTWEVFFVGTMTNNQKETHIIENAKYCSFSRVETIHTTQACGCVLERGSTDWTLTVIADPNVPSGKCRCEAVCIR